MSQRRWLAAVALASFALGFLLGYWQLRSAPAGFPEGDPTRSPRVGPAGLTREGAQLVVRYLWADGSLGREEGGPLPRELVGLDLEGLRRARPDWVIEAYAPERVVVRASCPDVPGGFVGVHNGFVAIFDGRPDGCRRLRETTGIPVARFPRFQRDELARGIPFHSDAELFQVLEGLHAP